MRVMRGVASTQHQLMREEMRMAEEERATTEAAAEHAANMQSLRLRLAEERARATDGAVEQLSLARAEVVDAERMAADAELHRREEAARMHHELIQLRQYLEREMRAGLEAFRHEYKREAFEEQSEEARQALVERDLMQAYAQKEHGWAERWQDRYDRLKATADGWHRELLLCRDEGEQQERGTQHDVGG